MIVRQIHGAAMFPVSVSGSIRLRNLANPTPFVKPVTERLVDMLDDAYASEVWPEDGTVRFKTSFLTGGGRWNILVPFDSGAFQIEIEDTALRVVYRLSTVRMLLAIIGLLGILCGAWTFVALRHAQDWHTPVRLFVFGWAWLFGMNYLTGMIRIPFWLKRGLKNIGQ